MGKQILVISNGFGEDQIACRLIQELKEVFVGSQIQVMPLVGEGLEYRSRGFTPLMSNPVFPSGGFIRNLKVLWGDIKAGLLRHTWAQFLKARQVAKQSDVVICVGDVFCLIVGTLTSHQTPTFFLPTAKSSRFMPHSSFEVAWIKRVSPLTFPRDQETLEELSQKGVNALYFGNPMMDHFQARGLDFSIPNSKRVVGLLPGSRDEATANLSYMLDCVLEINRQQPGLAFLCAKAKSISFDQIQECSAAQGWVLFSNVKDTFLMHTHEAVKVIFTEAFEDVVNLCPVLIGLAGTANEQAVYFGRRVLCFEGFGPQSTLQRFQEQRQLLGDLLTVVDPRSVSAIAQETVHQLTLAPDPLPPLSQLRASQKIAQTIEAVLRA